MHTGHVPRAYHEWRFVILGTIIEDCLIYFKDYKAYNLELRANI